MRKRSYFSLSVLFVAVIMTIVMVSAFCMPTAMASADAHAEYSVQSVESSYNGDRETFTVTLERIKEQKKEPSAIDQTKQFVKENGAAMGDFAVSMYGGLSDWAKNGKDADHLADAYGILKSGATMVATILGADNAVGPVFSVIDSLFSIGEEGKQSELEAMENRLDKQFDQVNEHIDEVQKDISDLSKKVDQDTKDVLKAISNTSNSAYAREQVSQFFSSGSGNFNYKQFNAYLFGSTKAADNPEYYTQAYYQQLVNVLLADKVSDEALTVAYNDLYRNLMSTTNGESNVNKLYDYMLGDTAGNSIISYYYTYTLDNREYFGNNLEYDAIELLRDMYSTALMADACINLCHIYFATKLYEQYRGEIYTSPATCWYYYGSGDNDKISYRQIVESADAIAAREDNLHKQFVKDVAFILNMKNSYTVQDGGEYWMATYNEENYGNVLAGQTIYLNTFVDQLCADWYLDIDIHDFTYTICDSNGSLLRHFDGFIRINDLPTDFIAQCIYQDDTVIYSVRFHIQNANDANYSGGKGTQNDPYLISNVSQLQTIEMDQGVYYKLIKDIDVSSLTSFGDKTYKFQGNLDGNGHTLSNFNVTGGEATGFFNYIGEYGTVSNLTLRNFTVTATDNDATEISVGALAGQCEGIVYNCHVENTTVNGNPDNMTRIEPSNKNINYEIVVNAGGLVGLLSGTVAYGDSSATVNARLHRNYGGNDNDTNKSTINAGGLVGKTTSGATITYCKSSATVKATCYSEMAKRNKQHPYIEIQAGGIVGNSQGAIDHVYSTANVTQSCDYHNNASMGSSDDKNVSTKADAYVAAYSGNVDSIKCAAGDIAFPVGSHSAFSFAIDANTDADYEGYYVTQIYDFGDSAFNRTGLTVNGADDYVIIGCYKFDTHISIRDLAVKGNAILLVAADGVLGAVTIPYYVKKIAPVELIIGYNGAAPSGDNESENYQMQSTGAWIAKCNNGDALFAGHNEVAYLVYQDGYRSDVTAQIQAYYLKSDGTQVTGTFQDLGLQEVFITLDGFTASYYVYVACEHQYADPVVVQPTCSSLGYDLHTCTLCGYYYRDNYKETTANHTPKFYTADDNVAISGIQPACEANCLSEGYTGDTYCVECLRILEYGRHVAALGHTYDVEHCDNDVHYCTRCLAAEQHVWMNAESGNYIIETCGVCKYQKEPQLKDLTTVPRVIVSSSYALPDSTVTVFVQLLNNPGITSTSFSIKYDERLQLVDWRQGNLLQNAVYSFSNGTNGICSFTSGRAQADMTESGNLIKLVFRTPSVADVGDTYRVIVGNSLSGKRFTDKNGKKIDIVCFDGEITIAEHLPGDVNGDNVVDIFDAVLIAEACNDGLPEEAQALCDLYGDVNFDGSVDNADMVRILRYLVGGYNCQLLADEFKAVLNHNDGENAPTTVIIKKGETYGDVLQFASRLGYRFDGWYDSVTDGNTYDEDAEIVFDVDQFERTMQQIYYAHWTINQINYDTGDAEHPIASANYLQYAEQDGKYTIDSLSTTYTVSYIDKENTDIRYDKQVQNNLLGWSVTEGSKVVKYLAGEIIDLSLSDPDVAPGNLTLYPVWRNCIINLPSGIPEYTKVGYAVEKWREHIDGSGEQYLSGNPCIVTGDTTFYAFWNEITYTVVFDTNGGGTDNIPEAITKNYSDSWSLPEMHPTKDRATFMGWTTKSLPVKLFRAGAAFETTFTVGDETAPYITEQNQVVTLYAVWNDDHYHNAVYDYIYFGNYPQEIIENDGIIAALDELAGALPSASDSERWTSYDVQSKNNAYNIWYMDVIYSGKKYRGIYFINLDTCLTYTYWFEYTPIKWNVLSESEGVALLLCEPIIDIQPYQVSVEKGASYALSTIRAWLNDEFLRTAFTPLQQRLLLSTSFEDAEGISDRIFLPSVEEVLGQDESILRKDLSVYVVLYTIFQDLLTNDNYDQWWTRTSKDNETVYVIQNATDNELSIEQASRGVAPAIRVGLQYDVWEHVHTFDEHCYCFVCEQTIHNFNEDCICERCGLEMHARDGKYCRHGDVIYFGSYPQTLVTDEAITTALTSQAGILPTADNAQQWTSYKYYIENSTDIDYMWFIDITYGGDQYRGVYFTQYRSTRVDEQESNRQSTNGYTTGNLYWFKFDLIRWRVLSESNGEALMLAEMALDSQEFNTIMHNNSIDEIQFEHNGGTGYANNYALSSIRKWLNDTFYNTAFTALQKELILVTVVDNSLESTGYTEAEHICENTNDKVFLLSTQEASNGSYGLSSDESRRKKPTDYAMSQGSMLSAGGYIEWWLRSPYYHTDYIVRMVDDSGPIYTGGIYNTYFCVVPALRIRLN